MLGFNILFLLIYVCFYIYIYKKYPVLMIIFFYLFYGYLSMVISCFYLDFGNVYAFEVERTSIQSNGVILLGFFYLSSFLLFLFCYKRIEISLMRSFSLIKFQKRIYLNPAFILGSLWFAFFFILIIYVHLFYSGVPLLLGYGKGQFWSYARFPFFNALHNQTSTVLVVLGFLYGYIKEFKYSDTAYTRYLKYFKFLLYIYIMYIVLMGYKFGGPLLYLFSFYLSTLVFFSLRCKLKLRVLLKYLTLALAFFTPVIWYIYENIYGFNGAVGQIIFDRVFALQGQLWHFIYNDVNLGIIQPNMDQLVVEIKYAFLGEDIRNVGINHLMQFIMPEERLNSYYSNSVRLSGGYPAYWLVIFNNYAVILLCHFLFSWLVFFFHYKFLYHLINLNLIKFIIWFKLAMILKAFALMGDLHPILSGKTVFYLVLLLAIYLFEEGVRIKNIRITR